MTTDTDTRPPLTARQAEVLRFIEDNAAMYGPTVREIARAFGMRSPHAVTGHLMALERKGYLRRRPRTVRGIEVVR